MATATKAAKLGSHWMVFNLRGEIVGTDVMRGTHAWEQAEYLTGLTREQMTRIGYVCVKCDVKKARDDA
jgi:hypothetical protein